MVSDTNHLKKVVYIIKSFIFNVFVLTIVWIVLREEFSLFNAVTGIVISIFAVYYSRKFLPLSKIRNVDFVKLAMYIVYLLGQIYLAGFYVIKMVITGKARADIVTIKTKLTNETLKVVLADSITLTPGSIFLDISDDNITVVTLVEQHIPKLTMKDGDRVKGKLEARLLKAQKG